MKFYQSADGRWIYFDGASKRYFDTERDAKMATQPTAMDTFATKYDALRTTAQSLFDQLHAVQRFLNANPQIAAETNAAESGALIGGSLMSKEQVQTSLLLFANGSAFASAEIVTGAGFSNEDAVLRQ